MLKPINASTRLNRISANMIDEIRRFISVSEHKILKHNEAIMKTTWKSIKEN